MRLRGTILLVTTVALMLPTAAAPAATRQMDSTDAPEVSGPLNQSSNQCKTQRERFQGDVVAVGKACLRIFRFDPESETDADRNYGVVWLQSNLNSGRGFCAVKVQSDVNLPSNIEVESRAPKGTTAIGRTKRMTTKVTTTAGDTATTNGEVSQDATVYRREIATRIIEEPARAFRLRWLGSSEKKLGFASGLEISWSADSSPGALSFRLNYSIKQKASC